VRRAWLCAGAFLLLAAPSFGDTIGVAGYSSWQWHGVSWTPPSGATTAVTSAVPSAVSAQSNVSTFSGGSDSSSTYSYWQWNGVSYSGPTTSIGSAGASSSLPASASPFVGNTGTASLSGYVYVDANSNQMMDSGDWAIADATITLTKASSSTPFATVLSNQDGSYSFDGLASGAYSVAMTTATNHPGQDSGQYRAVVNGSTVVSVGTDGTVEQNAYAGVTLADGDTGTNFNFAELTYPGDLISKAMLLTSSPPVIHTGDVTPVPEPPALALLAVAGLFLVGWSWRRCRTYRI
jgi:hypothetical protein